MLYAFGFERVGVVAGDLYFVNPRRLLDKVRAGELGRPPQVEGENMVRTGWL